MEKITVLCRFFLMAVIFIDICSANKFIESYVITHMQRNDTEIVKKYLWKNSETRFAKSDFPYILGMMYLGTFDFEKNLKFAGYFLKRSASMKNKKALNAVADGYYTGDTEVKNLKKAIEYYEISAKLGYGVAQFNAGIVYLKHFKNYKKAVYWLEKACDNHEDLDKIVRQKAKEYLNEAKLCLSK